MLTKTDEQSYFRLLHTKKRSIIFRKKMSIKYSIDKKKNFAHSDNPCPGTVQKGGNSIERNSTKYTVNMHTKLNWSFCLFCRVHECTANIGADNWVMREYNIKCLVWATVVTKLKRNDCRLLHNDISISKKEGRRKLFRYNLITTVYLCNFKLTDCVVLVPV